MADEEERIKAEKLAAAKKRVSLENRYADALEGGWLTGDPLVNR